jgi:amino acid transporter
LVDYILTVAVSVSAGTDAITSAFPNLHDYNVEIAIVFLIFLTLLNLKGVTESASILAYPVYLFVLAKLYVFLYPRNYSHDFSPCSEHWIFRISFAGG